MIGYEVVRRRRGAGLGAVLLAALLGGATEGKAQAEGTLAGRVTEAATEAPIPNAQVWIAAIRRGVLAGPDGRFTLSGLPAGPHLVTVQHLGYRTVTEEVRVAAGDIATRDFRLSTDVLTLDGLVVTGTAGQARRREIGNAVEQIYLDDIAEPLRDVDQLLAGRLPGVTLTQVSGQVGAASQIRLRGNSSLSMSNRPLVYVDGVRIRGDGMPGASQLGESSNRGPSLWTSPINDINPADIDRVEVLKGPAATTLYGTEAAAGVIQIFTKRGRSGASSWTFQTDQGLSRVQKFGTDDFPYMRMDPWLSTGHSQSYALSVRGGLESVEYFLSGAIQDVKGVLPDDREGKYMGRANIGVDAGRDLRLDWSGSYTRNDIGYTPGGNNPNGLINNAQRGANNFIGSDAIEDLRKILDYKIDTSLDHFTTGLTATHTPTARLSNRVTAGFDRNTRVQTQLMPFGFILRPEGMRTVGNWREDLLTLDYVGSFRADLGPELRSTFSWGGQSIRSAVQNVTAQSRLFAGPGNPTVSSGAILSAAESYITNVTGGVFLQSLFDLRNRYFLTVGVRVDGSSVFGTDFGWQTYPKISGSYVHSDEGFRNPAWGHVKLRGAWGSAGRTPGSFDAVRTWNTSSYLDAPAFLPGNVGNPDLGPERTTELELGFDASFLDDRLTLQFTEYRQATDGALLGVSRAPSTGFGGSQRENIGALRNWGREIALDGRIIDRESIGWDLGFTLATNHSEVVDLGGISEFGAGSLARVIEGQPVPVMRGDVILNPHELADPIIDQDVLLGPSAPSLTAGVNTSLTLPGGVAISARGEFQGGHYIYDFATWRSNASRVAVNCARAYEVIDGGIGSYEQLTARERALCGDNPRSELFVYPADFFKIREVSIRAPLGLISHRLANASITVSGRNFWRWVNSDFLVWEPEVSGDTGGINSLVPQINETIPAPAQITTSIRINF